MTPAHRRSHPGEPHRSPPPSPTPETDRPRPEPHRIDFGQNRHPRRLDLRDTDQVQIGERPTTPCRETTRSAGRGLENGPTGRGRPIQNPSPMPAGRCCRVPLTTAPIPRFKPPLRKSRPRPALLSPFKRQGNATTQHHRSTTTHATQRRSRRRPRHRTPPPPTQRRVSGHPWPGLRGSAAFRPLGVASPTRLAGRAGCLHPPVPKRGLIRR
jgi:hypothetical protein